MGVQRDEKGELYFMNNKRSFDVVVVGGGIAGISAALAASRNGARTCLIEKEYALGGLATLGLIIVYLPLCDGNGVQMSSGISEELIKLSLKYNNDKLPDIWTRNASIEERAQGPRYRVNINPASFMILTEQTLLESGVTLFYDTRLSEVKRDNGGICSVIIDTKCGKLEVEGKSFIDATGDADVCYFGGEETYTDGTNSRTGWFYSYDGSELTLHMLTDPYLTSNDDKAPRYSGTDIDQISQHMIDMRKMILNKVDQIREIQGKNVIPQIIPCYHGLRMTRRLAGAFEFSADKHNNMWFYDSIGMIGNWSSRGYRFSLPFRSIKGVVNNNLYAVGRCMCADKSGWDMVRVIPACAVTGEAAGTAAAIQVQTGSSPEISELQNRLIKNGVLLKPDLFKYNN